MVNANHILNDLISDFVGNEFICYVVTPVLWRTKLHHPILTNASEAIAPMTGEKVPLRPLLQQPSSLLGSHTCLWKRTESR